MAPIRSRRPPLVTLLRRWSVVAVVLIVGYLYYHPLRTYLATRHELIWGSYFLYEALHVLAGHLDPLRV